MKILMVNKFLYHKGGAETYVFKLGKILEDKGHEVQYFGLQNSENVVGNQAGAYVMPKDFQSGIKNNLKSPLSIIYSSEARKKIGEVLEKFSPDIIHLNNIQFHLTPSIILEAEKYRRNMKNALKIIYTAHDYQLICPSHGLFDSDIQVCEKCLSGNYTYCVKTKCIKGSSVKSFLGMIDAYFWKINKAYSYIDKIICPSEFLKNKLDLQKRFAEKTVTLHNFVDYVEDVTVKKDNYVLEFGKLCRDKGTNTLLKVCKRIPEVKFLFAGYGPAQKDIEDIPNAEYVGFKTGKELEMLIRKAKCSIYPSEWYENCPFSVIESQMYGTPVIGSRMGGIPELIREGETGELFEAGNVDELEKVLKKVLYTPDLLEKYSNNCLNLKFETSETYYNSLMKIYGGNE